jgi:molecular chaperone GrpE (heat shock protein)
MAAEAGADGEMAAEGAAQVPAGEAAEAPLDSKAAKRAEREVLRAEIDAMEKTLTKKRGALAQAMDDAKDAGEAGYMLLAANFERARQSARTELEGQAGFGRLGGMRPLIPFFEEFGALQAESTGGETGSDAVHRYYCGIHKQVVQLMETEKVAPFDVPVGSKYEWMRHKEVGRRASADVPNGAILEVVSPGYMMGSEVLREAEVIVSSGVMEPQAMDVENVPGQEAAEAGQAEGAAPAEAE